MSLRQPQVRPLVRGKAGCPVECGAKISVSLVAGVSFVDRISWDAYNESLDLVAQIEAYRRRFGHSPASVHVDQTVRTVVIATAKGFVSQGHPWGLLGR